MNIRMLAVCAPLAALGIAVAPAASAACRECGTVVNLKKVEKEGEATGGGAVIGGIAGGVLGHQIEKSRNKTVSYEVVVKMEDGRTRTFTYKEPTGFHMGDRVKIVDHRLTHY